MIEWLFLGKDSEVILDLSRSDSQQFLYVKEEKLPTLSTAGQFIDIVATGVRIHVGSSVLKSDSYSLTLGLNGRDQSDVYDLMRQVVSAAANTYAISRSDGGVLYVAKLKQIDRVWTATGLTGMSVTLTFEPTYGYWATGVGQLQIEMDVVKSRNFNVVSAISSPISLEITTGVVPEVDPYVQSTFGRLTFLGTFAPFTRLTVINRPGQWSVLMNGITDISNYLAGQQPFAEPGNSTFTMGFKSGICDISWIEFSH